MVLNMENTQTEEQCRHPECHCPKPPSSDYCSEYCESKPTGGLDMVCKCGHPECVS